MYFSIYIYIYICKTLGYHCPFKPCTKVKRKSRAHYKYKIGGAFDHAFALHIKLNKSRTKNLAFA